MQDAKSFQARTFGSEKVLALVADKWTVQIIHAIMEGHNRFGEMRRAIPTSTRRMLSHVDYGEVPPRVVYGLTALGQSLAVELKALCLWSKRNFDEVEKARSAYESLLRSVQQFRVIDQRPGDIRANRLFRIFDIGHNRTNPRVL
ncbi:MAG: helix-turn-helix transcriptional regulator [Anaerolinea sp.]|nr:helix-turn-helix transcriptional regulator [Anaerolinea sp.]